MGKDYKKGTLSEIVFKTGVWQASQMENDNI
jgi:hypothetical protein